jgi:phosphatidylinositol kinase/protein kinase (PI-3  family)
MNSGTTEEAVDRVFSGVGRKLDKTLNVVATVSGLIAEATDLANLCGMFTGWQPYL